MRGISTLVRKWSRKPILGALVAACGILVIEVTLRVGAFIWYDSSWFYLQHGLPNRAGRLGINPGSTDDGSHYTFPPHYALRGAAGQSDETASINSHGFRGPEFQRHKPAGTFRVVCLGESSTFGFRNSDDETYPFLLEGLFRDQPTPVRVEVINAGFPYYNSGSILSLLETEILKLDPDVLTLYSAYNDVHWPLRVGYLARLRAWLIEHSVTYLLMKETILKDRLGVLKPRRIDRGQFEKDTQEIIARYRANYQRILALARREGIPVVLIKQPMTARYTHIKAWNYVRTYEQEYQSIVKKLDANRRLTGVETQILVHHRLVDELETIAKREHLTIVDNIALLDRDRRLMASTVHLTAAANRNLAIALQKVIAQYLPPSSSVTVGEPARVDAQ